MLFKEHADFVWGFIGSIWVANFLGLILVLAFAPAFPTTVGVTFGKFGGGSGSLFGIIFAVGPLTGTSAPNSGRATVCSLSPQAYPYEWFSFSSFGGYWGPTLKYAGYDAIVVQGQAERPVYTDQTIPAFRGTRCGIRRLIRVQDMQWV